MEETKVQIPPERLDQIAHRFAELEARMASGTLEGEAFVRASRDYAELEPVAKIAAEVKSAREEMAGLCPPSNPLAAALSMMRYNAIAI